MYAAGATIKEICEKFDVPAGNVSRALRCHSGLLDIGGKRKKLTVSRLKRLVSYDPDTGVMVRKIDRPGAPAARVNPAPHGEYMYVKLDGTRYMVHRLVFLYMEGEWPPVFVDHINGDTNDNRWSNLRHVSKRDNTKNRRLGKNNTSGEMNVMFLRGKYIVRIEGCHIGTFKTMDEAVEARNTEKVLRGFHENHGSIRVKP